MTLSQRGSALVYILIGIGLMALLSFSLSRQANQDGGIAQTIPEDKALILAADLINHATSVRSVIQQMQMLGIDFDSIDFTKSGESGYTTGPFDAKVFHPSGGGVKEFNQENTLLFNLESGSCCRGWQIQDLTNVEWTPTSATDIIYSFLDINEQVCSAINKKLHGFETIPRTTNEVTYYLGRLFINTGDTTDLSEAACSDCVGITSLCVRRGNTELTAFYNVVGQR